MKELNDLVDLAQMATAGGWTTDLRGSVVAVDDQANSGFIICSAGGCDKSHNAAFIAAANPAAILAIAEAFRALEQQLSEVRQYNFEYAQREQELEQRAEAAEASLKLSNEHAEKFEREMYLMMDKAEAAEAKRATAERAIDNLDAERSAMRAKLTELEKQEPVGTVSISMDWNTHRNIATVNMRPDLVVAEMKNGYELFTRPTPAVSLAELVPDEMTLDSDTGAVTESGHVQAVKWWNACRTAILRNIEEQSL